LASRWSPRAPLSQASRPSPAAPWLFLAAYTSPGQGRVREACPVSGASSLSLAYAARGRAA
jgi:hypothetical protein